MKNQVKRLFAILLASLFLLSAACNGADNDGSNSKEISAEETSSDAYEDKKLGKLNKGYDVDEGAAVLEGDVVLLQLSGISAFAAESGNMPTLANLCKNGLSYSNFYAQQGKDQGVYSALTSLYAPLDDFDTDAGYYTLAHLFKENGYSVKGDEGVCNAALAEALGISVAEGTEGAGKTFTVKELSVQYPYIPEGVGGAIEGDRSLNSYLSCAADVDGKLKALLDEYKALGDKAPILIVYGTAPILEESYVKYTEEYTDLFPNGFSYDQAYRVPFAVYGKGVEKGTADSFGTIYDVFPTVAAMFGLESDKMLVSGVNLYSNGKLPQKEAAVADAVNLAANKSYTLAVSDGSDPAYMFKSLADDGVKLTDGIIDDGKGIPESDIGAILWKVERTHEITVDLGEEKSFDRVVLAGISYDGVTHFALNDDSFTLSVSDDGKKFTDVSGECLMHSVDGSVYRSYTKSASKAIEARYVKISFTGSKGYMSVTEILVYECPEDGNDAIDLEGFRFFAPQGDLMRGSFITDTVYYVNGEAAVAYNKATGNEISARNYKAQKNAVLKTINECEHAVDCGYFAGEKDYKGLYDSLPNESKLLVKVENALENGTMFGGKGYLSKYAMFYQADALSGIKSDGLIITENGMSLAGGCDKGEFISDSFTVAPFEKLYVVPACKLNGGTVRVYVSYGNDKGINTPWELLDAYSAMGFYEGKSCISVSATDGGNFAARNFRIKIELEAKEKSPVISALHITPAASPELTQQLPDADTVANAVEVFVNVAETPEVTDSGIIAVETLVAEALTADFDFLGAGKYIGSLSASSIYAQETPAITALARYACEKGLKAFIDVYGINEMITAINGNQPIIFENEGKYVIANGYSEKGITVVDPSTGEAATLPFENISINTEVLIVDSALLTPQIIDDFIAEDSAVRPGIVVDKKKYIVVHNTGNYGPSSTAAAHATYLHGLANSPDRSVSWHYTVDSKEIYHHLPDNESAWHASDGTHGEGNKYGIGIETCVNGFPGTYQGEAYEEWLKDFTVTVKNLSYLVAKLMIENDIPLENVKQHYDFAPNKKNCPMQMRYSSGSDTFEHEGDMWVYFIEQVKLQHARLIAEGYRQ